MQTPLWDLSFSVLLDSQLSPEVIFRVRESVDLMQRLDTLKWMDSLDNCHISSFVKRLLPVLMTEIDGISREPMDDVKFNEWKIVN